MSRPGAGLNASADANDLARRIATPFLVEVELLERRLIACNEQEQWIAGGGIDVLEPGTAGHSERIEYVPVEPLPVDDRMALALERGDQQARGLSHGLRTLARAQHLHEERDGLEHRASGGRIDVFDHEGVVRIAVP